jgi:hypothetical protein
LLTCLVFTTVEKFENLLGVQSESAVVMSVFEGALDEQRRILGLEQAEVLPTPKFASSHANQGGEDEITRIFEDVLDEKRRILAQDFPRPSSTSGNVAILQGSQREVHEESKVFVDVFDGGGHQNPFLATDHFASPLGHRHVGEAAAIFENVLDERRSILSEECVSAFSGNQERSHKITSIFNAPEKGQQSDAAESSSSSSSKDRLTRIGRDHQNHVTLEFTPADEEDQESEKDAIMKEGYALSGLGPPGYRLEPIEAGYCNKDHFHASFILHPPSDDENADQAHNSKGLAENTSEPPPQVKESVPIASGSAKIH